MEVSYEMFNVNTRAIASFVLAIFLMFTSVVLIAWACDALKRAVETRKINYEDAKTAVRNIEASGVMDSIATGSTVGMVSTGAAGVAFGASIGLAGGPVGVKAGAITIGAAGAVTGGIGGGIAGVFGYYQKLSDAKDNVETYRKLYAEAQMLYEHCLNPPALYTYTDPNTGYVYEFCATMYGSDEAAYDAYWDFIESRGHPGSGN